MFFLDKFVMKDLFLTKMHLAETDDRMAILLGMWGAIYNEMNNMKL